MGGFELYAKAWCLVIKIDLALFIGLFSRFPGTVEGVCVVSETMTTPENNESPVAPVYQPKVADSSAALWRTIAILLAVLLVGVLAFLLGRNSFLPADMEVGAAAATEMTQESSSGGNNVQAAQPEFAPSLEDPKALEILRAEPKRDAADPRAVGKVDAPVVLVEFTDYSCPMCTKFAHETEPGLQELIDNGTLRIEYRDLVIFPNYGSDIAAAGGWAAAEQGKHSEYRQAVWAAAGTGHPEYSVDSVVELAKAAGVPDLDKFRASVQSAETKAKVDEQTKHAQSLGIGGTPFLMINDTGLGGAYPLDFVKRTIEEQAKLVK